MTLISHSQPLLGTAVYNSALRPPRTLWPLPFRVTRTDLVKLRVICRSFLDVAEYSAHVLQAYGHGVYWWAELSLSVHCMAAKKHDREKQLIF